MLFIRRKRVEAAGGGINPTAAIIAGASADGGLTMADNTTGKTAPFTIGAWWKSSDVTTYRPLFYTTTGKEQIFLQTGQIKYSIDGNSGVNMGAVSINTWYYWEVMVGGFGTSQTLIRHQGSQVQTATVDSDDEIVADSLTMYLLQAGAGATAAAAIKIFCPFRRAGSDVDILWNAGSFQAPAVAFNDAHDWFLDGASSANDATGNGHHFASAGGTAFTVSAADLPTGA